LNPEELIAAAHSGCFAMAFSMILGLAGFPPSKIQAQATVTLEKVGDGFSVTSSHLDVEASVPGISESAFKEAADKAKANCPISKLLKAEITMDARLAA
jgi:osmotically inducible protein OsmC